MNIRSYKDEDYDNLKQLYLDTNLYGGSFDEFRDGRDTLAKKISQDSEAIIVAEEQGELIGSISIIEDGRVAWLYRFVALKDNTAEALYEVARETLSKRGHKEVLVYSDPNNDSLTERYTNLLGFNRGNNFVCFWKEII